MYGWGKVGECSSEVEIWRYFVERQLTEEKAAAGGPWTGGIPVVGCGGEVGHWCCAG
jgi:hypothetical protein